MRVAIVSWSSRRVGGVEDYLSLLIPAMHHTGLDVAFWHEVDMPRDRVRIAIPAGVSDMCGADQASDASLRQLREWKPDVLYMQGLSDVETEAKLLEIAPAILFLHTYAGTCISGTKMFARPRAVPCDRTFGFPCLLHYFPHGCGGNNPSTMWRLFNGQSERLKLLHRYAAILTISDHMRGEMAKHGLHAEVVPYPVDASYAADVRLKADATYDVSTDDVSATVSDTWDLLYVGRMEGLKGGHYLIRALPEIARAARRPVRLTLAGDGRDRSEWETLARNVEKATANLTIEFTGWLTHREIAALMSKADLLVVPSLWPEPLGAVGPAAAHHGLPAAAFATGGISEWLTDSVSGHLAPADPPTPSGLARAVIQCLENPAHHAALRRGARQRAGHFTIERHLPALMSAFDRVRGSNGRS